MFDTSLTPPHVDQPTIDHYVAKGRRMRSHAFLDLFQALFSAPKTESVPAVRTCDQAA